MTFDGWQKDVQEKFALPLYQKIWDGCRVHENDSRSEDEETALVLDYGDVDKIILQQDGTQIHMAQRFRKPYYSNYHEEWRDPDFTLRYSRPHSDKTIEYERLFSAFNSDNSSYPPRYSFGRVYNDMTKGLYGLYILDTERLLDAISCDSLSESGPIPTEEGQEMMAYSVPELVEENVVVHQWQDGDGFITTDTKPDEPGKITSWSD